MRVPPQQPLLGPADYFAYVPLLSGFVTGQIAVAKAVGTVAAESFAGIMIRGCTRAQFFESLAKLQLSVWFSLVPRMPTGDHWFVLGRRIGEQKKTSGLGLFAHDQRYPGHARTRIRREPCKVGNRFAGAHVSPNIELTSHSAPSQK